MHAWAMRARGQAGGRATPPEKIHLTLAFLGDVPQPDVDRVVAAARRVRGAACTLLIGEARFWPHNRIVWAGPRETPAALVTLAEELRIKLGKEGFPLERRPFAAHITVLRKARDARALPPLPTLEWPVTEFHLVRSMLGPDGSTYETVARFALDAGQEA